MRYATKKQRPRVYAIRNGGSVFCIGEPRRDLINYDYADKHFTIDEMLARVPEINEFSDVRHEQFLNMHGAEVSPERGWT